MSMDPLVAKALQQNVPELAALRAYLSSELAALNRLDGLDKLPAEERAIEATARLRAYEKVKEILTPLINTSGEFRGMDPKEYVT